MPWSPCFIGGGTPSCGVRIGRPNQLRPLALLLKRQLLHLLIADTLIVDADSAPAPRSDAMDNFI
jgi:hypothetical protein